MNSIRRKEKMGRERKEKNGLKEEMAEKRRKKIE